MDTNSGIKDTDIASKKVIGKVKNTPVIEMVTHGGLNLIVMNKNGKLETLAAAPHRAISRYIAEKNEPDLEITELSKSEGIPLPVLDSIAGPFFELTKAFNK